MNLSLFDSFGLKSGLLLHLGLVLYLFAELIEIDLEGCIRVERWIVLGSLTYSVKTVTSLVHPQDQVDDVEELISCVVVMTTEFHFLQAYCQNSTSRSLTVLASAA